MQGPSTSQKSRGVSSLIGVILVFGIVIVGITAVLIGGSATLDNLRYQSDVDQAVQSLAKIDERASLVGYGSSSRQQVVLPTTRNGGSLSIDEQAGWINVTIQNMSTGNTEEVVLNESMGAITYEHDDTYVVYEGGGIWKRVRNRSVVVSSPELSFTDKTLSLPLLVLRGQSLDNRVWLEANGSNRKFPSETGDYSNPLDPAKVSVTIHSNQYEAWGDVLVTRTNATVTVNHTHKTVSMTFQSGQTAITNGLMSSTGGYTIEIDNQGFSDSYDSTDGPYSQSQSENGTIQVAGGVTLQGQSEIKGDLISGSGQVSLDGPGTQVTGNLSYGGSLGPMTGTVDGWIGANGSAPNVATVDDLVDSKKNEIQASNDNDETNVITGNELNLLYVPPWELSSGTYYFNKLVVPTTKTLTLNTNNGDIIIAVDNEIDITGDVEVIGDGSVTIYQEGTSISLNLQGNVSTPGDKADQLWVYGPSNLQAEFDNQAEFVGVLYAPGPNGQIQLDQGADIYGAVVGRVTQVRNSAGIHFDKSLDGQSRVNQDLPTIQYMHISINNVTVSR